MVTRRSTTSTRLSPSGLHTLVSSHARARTIPALESRFSTHCERNADTAQGYRNEEEAGQAIRESGLARKDLFITTKFSGRDGLGIEESIQNSLKFVSFPLCLPRVPCGRSHHLFGILNINSGLDLGSWAWTMSTCI